MDARQGGESVKPAGPARGPKIRALLTQAAVIVPIRNALFHHEVQRIHSLYPRKRIGPHGDKIGSFADFQATKIIGPAQQICPVKSRGK